MYMSEQEYKKELERIEIANASKERRQNLKKEKQKFQKHLKLPSTSKLMAVYLFILLNVVLTYAMYTMWVFQDLQYLGVLITDIAAQVITYFVYCKKATVENSAGGIVFEKAMRETEDEIVG